MPAHRAYVSSAGPSAYTYTCTCGVRGGNYGSRRSAQNAAHTHEVNPGRLTRRG